MTARWQRRHVADIDGRDRSATWIRRRHHDRGAYPPLDHVLRHILHLRQGVLPDDLTLLLWLPPAQEPTLRARRDEPRRVNRERGEVIASGVEVLDDAEERLIRRVVNRSQRHAGQSTRQDLAMME